MERLTYFEGGRWWVKIGDTEHSGPVADRLAAYEDTGLEPGQIVGLCSMSERAKMADLLRLEDYQALGPIDHLRELAQAEKDGRLVALPCKVGDTIWTNTAVVGDGYKPADRPYPIRVVSISMEEEERFLHVQYSNGRVLQFYFDQVGRIIFLTRAEAEAALERRKKEGEII